MPPRKDYARNPAMRTGEALLWRLGYVRRWSSHSQAWVVHADPMAIAMLQSALGSGKSNIITRKYLQEAIQAVQAVQPLAMLYQNNVQHGSGLKRVGNGMVTPNVNAAPSQQEMAAFNARVFQEFLARERVATGVAHATTKDLVALQPGQQVPDWEVVEGPYIIERWNYPGHRLLGPWNTHNVQPLGSERQFGAGVGPATIAAFALPPLPVQQTLLAAPLAQPTAAAANPLPSVSDASGSNMGDDDARMPPLELNGGQIKISWVDVQRLMIRFWEYDEGLHRSDEWAALPAQTRRAVVAFGLFKLCYIDVDMHFIAVQHIRDLDAVWQRLDARNQELDGDRYQDPEDVDDNEAAALIYRVLGGMAPSPNLTPRMTRQWLAIQYAISMGEQVYDEGEGVEEVEEEGGEDKREEGGGEEGGEDEGEGEEAEEEGAEDGEEQEDEDDEEMEEDEPEDGQDDEAEEEATAAGATARRGGRTRRVPGSSKWQRSDGRLQRSPE